MMMAVAGTRTSATPFDFDRKPKPTPMWVYLVIGGSVLAHIAGGVWLYHQRYDMPTPITPPDRDVDGIIITLPQPPPPPVDAVEPPAPPIAVHNPVVIHTTTVAPSPIPVPDNPPSDTAPIGGPITLDPVVDTTVIGTSTEPTTPRPPSVITNPRWVSMPSAAQMERAYPRRAAQAEVGGNAVLSCSVTATGSVTNCSLVSETPAGMGFGNAAMSLARHFRLSPRTVDGQAVEGARVSIPLTFSLGD